MSAFASTAFAKLTALSDTAFDFGTSPTPVTPTMMGNGAWIPLQRRKKERYERVRAEDFDSDVTPEPLTPAASAEPAPNELAPPTVGRGPLLPALPAFELPVAWTPHVEDADAVTRRHLARVAAVAAARERNRIAAAQRARLAAEHEARLAAHIADQQARQLRARHDASAMSLLLQLDDL